MHERDDDDQGGGGSGTGKRVPMPFGPALSGGGQPTVDVRLRREFKGLTVEELVADLGIDEQLPGRVQSALEAIRRGDLRAAEDALPGRFGAVLPGPGHRAGTHRRRAFWIVVAALAAGAVGATIPWLRSR
jgi:hypothetical protein